MNTLANITNSTIFATEQLVGNQSKGGTWNLEKSASPRRAAPFSAEARDGFEGVLVSINGDLAASILENNSGIDSYTITRFDLFFTDTSDITRANKIFTVSSLVNGSITVLNQPAFTFTAENIFRSQVRFVHNGLENATAGFTVTMTESGTVATNNPLQFNFTVTPVNDRPTLILDGVSSSFSTSYDEAAQVGTPIVGSGFAIVDPDSNNMDNLSIVLTNAQYGDQLNWNRSIATRDGFDVSSESQSNQIILTIVGDSTQTKAQFEELVKTITFSNLQTEELIITPRSLELVVNDGQADSFPAAVVTINVTSPNDAPFGIDNTLYLDEDSSIPLTVANFGFSDPAEGDALLAIKIISLPNSLVSLMVGQI